MAVERGEYRGSGVRVRISLGEVGGRSMACSPYFSGRDLGSKRLISDPHPRVQGTQALSPFTLLLHLSHSQPPLINILDSRIFLAV